MKDILKHIPKSPGIYKFLDDKKNIIYIGKSVNLKSRVLSYFNGKSKLNFAKKKMVSLIKNVETIITANEIESLILESTLIKKHKPKYNILMKDDKNYLYVKITNDIIPRIIKTRIKGKTGTFFGPYTSTSYVNNTLKVLKKSFGYRSCRIVFGEKENSKGEKNIIIKSSYGTKIPCLDYYIKRCSAPCLLDTEKVSEYKKSIENIKYFFKGNTKEITKKLETEMQKKAKELKFEEAKTIKENLDSIKNIEIHQTMRDSISGDFDVLHYLEKYDNFYIGFTKIRESKIIGFQHFQIENKLKENKEEILKQFIEREVLQEKYIKNTTKYTGPTILSPISIKLSNDAPMPIIEIPQIGNKVGILSFVYRNLYEFAYKKYLASLSTKGFTKKTMQNLLKVLGYKEINKNIIFECNDISHISGNHTVASRSIIENGKIHPSKYRKFRIKTLDEGKIDDFGSMKEIMERRLKEIIKTKKIPDLIIIDGGKGQLSSVLKVVEVFSNKDSEISLKGQKLLKKLQIVSIAKKEEELYLPGETHPIILKKDSLELRLTQKIRDEAHRFAITFNRDSRNKAMKKNILESLPGFGSVTRKKILKQFGSVENLRKIERKELGEILNKTQIETLDNHGLI